MTHSHPHDHAHSHGSHDHADPHDHHGANEGRLFWAALFTGIFMLVEAAGGVISGSLTLLADAGHMLADFAGLILAWFAFRVSRWPADRRRTYGFERMQVIVAFGNGLVLFIIAGAIVTEAIRRLLEPSPVLGGTMLLIAAIGLAINVVLFYVLHGADRENLNVRGAMVHVIGDLLGSAGAIVGALIIMSTNWTPADPLISILVAVIILRSAGRVVRDSVHILLEAAPTDVSAGEVRSDLQENVPGIEDVHHVHAWSITEERPMVTLHARISEDADAETTVVAIKRRLFTRFGIGHATVEIERTACADAKSGLALAEHQHSR